MARITAGVAASHVPAIGVAVDLDKTQEPYWKPVFDGFEWTKQWIAGQKPDVVIIAYNDHANGFTPALLPAFALGTGASYQPADEGHGPRPIPVIEGHEKLAGHLAQSLILDEFDLTLVNELVLDHGLTVPLSLMFGKPEAWPCKVIPLAVGVVQFPAPTGKRCYDLGRAIRRAVETFPEDLNVQVWATGGMSHQIQGPRAGLINKEWDVSFLDRLSSDPQGLAKIEHLEYLRETGSEGIELVMWNLMRGALGERVTELHRHYHIPASCTAVGHIVFRSED